MPIATDFFEKIVGKLKKLPPAAPTTATVIFFDWDDTLLCSSVLSSHGIKLDSCLDSSPDLCKALDELSTLVIEVLNLAQTYGEVIIVTNGETGWVELSARSFFPRVVPLLSKFKIISARSTYEKSFPDAPTIWKYHAFQNELVGLYTDPNCIKNIISIGDSHAEREAIRAVTKDVPSTRTKSIKFAERPSVEQLVRQLELIQNCFEYINNHEEDLDLCMSLSVAEEQTQES